MRHTEDEHDEMMFRAEIEAGVIQARHLVDLAEDEITCYGSINPTIERGFAALKAAQRLLHDMVGDIRASWDRHDSGVEDARPREEQAAAA